FDLDANANVLDIFQAGLFKILGPQGINVLKDGPDPGSAIGPSDIAISYGNDKDAGGQDIPGTAWIQFDIKLAQRYDQEFHFDAGVDAPPALQEFAIGADGGIRFDANWSWNLGFGISARPNYDGFYLVAGPNLPPSWAPNAQELRFAVSVSAAPPKD